MMTEFDPRCVSKELDEIIPPNENSISIDDALSEMKPIVDEISSDVSGVGKTAAKRYLLRYEYGIAPSTIADEFGVTSQTVSNQVSAVRTKVLRYPRLARVIGTLRAHRAGLSQPEIDDGQTWEGEVSLHGEPIQYHAEFKSGTAGRPYSWCYSCESRYERDTRYYHLFEDYLIDAVQGVFLKRLLWGFSRKSWNRPPQTDQYRYTVYPLPNLEIPNSRDGSLFDAAEYQWAYDTNNYFEPLITEEPKKSDLEIRAEDGEMPIKGSAYYAQDDVLSHRIRNSEDCNEAINDYNEAVYVRNNIEQLLRMYPFYTPFELPYETFSQVWNGQPSSDARYDSTHMVDKKCLHRMVSQAESYYRGRNIRFIENENINEMPMW